MFVAVYLLLLREEQVLLRQRHNTGYEDGSYSAIAGHVEPDERITHALVREAAEEAGIRLAASVGVAPLKCDSRTLQGRRTLLGGRAHVRTVLSMGTRVAPRVNPPSKAFYQRLLAAGKLKKVALTACMHKWLTMLTAMLKHRTSWKGQEVQN